MVLSTSHPNNTVSLDDGSIVCIQEFYKEDENIFVKVRKYMRIESVFNRPREPKDVFIHEVSRLSATVSSIPLQKIRQKFIKFQMNFPPIDDERYFVVKILH